VISGKLEKSSGFTVVEISCPGSRMVGSVSFNLSREENLGRQTELVMMLMFELFVEETRQARLSFQRIPPLFLRRAGMDSGNSVGLLSLMEKKPSPSRFELLLCMNSDGILLTESVSPLSAGE